MAQQKITGKQVERNYDYRTVTLGSNFDTSGTTFVDGATFSNLDIPSWATKAIVTVHCPCSVVTSTTDGFMRVMIGGTDTTYSGIGTRMTGNSEPVGGIKHVVGIMEIPLTATGTRSATLQVRESAGTGAIRLVASWEIQMMVQYFA